MKSRIPILCIPALVIIVAVAVPALAIDKGFYVGGGIGVASFDVADFYPDYQRLQFEEGNPGYKLFGGYRILRYLGVELGYVNYGNVTRREQLRQIGYQEVSVGIHQWDASALGMLPLSKKTSLFAKLGAASWNTDVNVINGPYTEDLSSSGTDITFGLGIDFLFKKVGMRVEGEWVDIPDTSGVFLVSLNMTYNF